MTFLPQIRPLRPQIEPLRQQIWNFRSQIRPFTRQIRPPRPQIKPLRPRSWSFGLEQVTLGHNIVADGWAGASNPHPHPNPQPYTQASTKKVSKTFHFFTQSPWTDAPTDGPTDQQTDKASYIGLRCCIANKRDTVELHSSAFKGTEQK